MNNELTFYQKLKALFIQFLSFGIVGVIKTMAFFAIYYGLFFAGVHYVLAYAIGFIATVAGAFFLNRKFVFKSDEDKSKTKQLVKMFAVYLATLFLGFGLIYLQVDIVGISAVIAPILNYFVTIPLNFILNKYWAFR